MSKILDFFNKATGQIVENSLGYQQIITTLTAVGRKLSMQKFYEIPFADYVPVVVGQGAFNRQLINWRAFLEAEGFEGGIMGNASNEAQTPLVSAAFDQVPQKILNWRKGIIYNVFELQEAMQANTLFSLIEAREKARRREWDLGIQKVAFLGVKGETGLLNNANVLVDTTNLTKRLYNMTASELNTFVGTMVGLFRANCNYTAYPSMFIIPEADRNGLANYPDPTFTLKTRLQILLESFQQLTMNPNFKILPSAYCDKANYDLTNNCYVLGVYDEESGKMDLPIDYVPTATGTCNGFDWTNVAYGQFTGVVMQRPKEFYYFTNTAT